MFFLCLIFLCYLFLNILCFFMFSLIYIFLLSSSKNSLLLHVFFPQFVNLWSGVWVFLYKPPSMLSLSSISIIPTLHWNIHPVIIAFLCMFTFNKQTPSTTKEEEEGTEVNTARGTTDLGYRVMHYLQI